MPREFADEVAQSATRPERTAFSTRASTLLQVPRVAKSDVMATATDGSAIRELQGVVIEMKEQMRVLAVAFVIRTLRFGHI